MSDDPDRLTPAEERDLQAAEYVLGALPQHQARALEALALNDPTVAASIAAWEQRLAPLTDLVEPQAPPAVLWRRLALATGIGAPAPTADRLPGLLRAVNVWRASTAGALALAAALGVLLVLKPSPEPRPLMAALSPYGGPGATFLVRIGVDGIATVVAVGDTNVPQGRTLELWAVIDNAAPVSLGLLPGNGRAQLTLRPQSSGTQLLVSQEPIGGSPTNQPTGPVVYAGKLTGI